MGMNSLKHLANESKVIQICFSGNSRGPNMIEQFAESNQ